MNYYFWNSLTNAGGYKAVELVDGEIRQIKLPSFIDAELSNGACQMMLRTSIDGERCFLIVKGFKYKDTERKFDAQGRDVNINLVIESGINDYEVLAKISVGFLTEWDNCRRFLGEPIEESNNGLCYNINQKRYERLLDSLASSPLRVNHNEYNLRLNANSSHALLVLSSGSGKDYYERMKQTLYGAFKLPNDNKEAWSVIVSSEDFASLTNAPQTSIYCDFENLVLGKSSNQCVQKESVCNPGNSEQNVSTCIEGSNIVVSKEEESTTENGRNHSKMKDRFDQLPSSTKYILVFLMGLLIGGILF